MPFTAITAVILDGDKFSNIEADNGKVMELDGTTAVLGTAMPGLADSLRRSLEPLGSTAATLLGAAAVVALRLCAAYFRWNLPKASPSPGGARR